MKKIIYCLLICLAVTGCNQNDTTVDNTAEQIDYKTLKNVSLDGVKISTMLDIAGINDISDFMQSNDKKSYRFIYQDSAISNNDYQKLIDYLYKECYGYDSLAGVINIDSNIGNYEVFYKYSKTNGKAIEITIKESIANSKSIYDITYRLVDFDDEIYYMRYVGTNDGTAEYKMD